MLLTSKSKYPLLDIIKLNLSLLNCKHCVIATLTRKLNYRQILRINPAICRAIQLIDLCIEQGRPDFNINREYIKLNSCLVYFGFSFGNFEFN